MRPGNLRALGVALFGILLLGACPQHTGGDLPFLVPIIPKKIVESNVGGSIRYNPVKALCYVDVTRYNPLNAGDYILDTGKTQFFDCVVLGAAQIKYGKERGPWLYIPPDLEYVLRNRNLYVKPLQMKGIRVLLGVTGGMDNYSFGSLTTDEARIFTEELMGPLRHFGLDGVELNDENAGLPGQPFYPNELRIAGSLGDIDENGSPNEAADEEAAWFYGGDMMCNLTYYLRLELDKYESSSAIEEHERIIVVKETNFGRCFPYNVSGSADEPTFVTSVQETDYFVNPYFYRFVPDSAQREKGNSVDPIFRSFRYQYAPLIVDLGGPTPPDPAGRVIPTLNASNPANAGDDSNPGSIFDFHTWFKNGGYPGYTYTSGACNYGLLYYHNLKAVSEAAAEDYLYSPVYSRKLTQAEYMTTTALTLFKDRVVLAPGALGDYKKTW